jgi:chromosome segregation ATPase
MSFNPSPSHLIAQLGREQARNRAQLERIADLDATIGATQAAYAEARRVADAAIAQVQAAEADIADMQAVLIAMSRDIAERDAMIEQLRREADDRHGRLARAAEREADRLSRAPWLAWLLS